MSIAFLRDHGAPRISQLLDHTRAFETLEKLLDEPCCTRWGSGRSHTGYGSQPSAPSGHAPSSYAYCPRGRTVGPRFPEPRSYPFGYTLDDLGPHWAQGRPVRPLTDEVPLER